MLSSILKTEIAAVVVAFLFTTLSSAADSTTYTVSLDFEFSPTAKAHESYAKAHEGDKNAIIGHVSVQEKIEANSYEDAIAKAKALVGTKYDKSVEVFTCYPSEEGKTPQHCKSRVTNAKIVGLELEKIGPTDKLPTYCKIADSLMKMDVCPAPSGKSKSAGKAGEINGSASGKAL